MLISISGMVGSGKTTVANRLLDVLRGRGHDAMCLRFQTLPCFTFLRSPRRKRESPGLWVPAQGEAKTVRSRGYRRSTLTIIVALTYLARIVAFRIYRLSWRSRRTYILNRYFYDLFVHYRLESRSERFYCKALRALMPAPEISILLTAAPDTIAQRRPHYSAEYLTAVGAAYLRLRQFFPELIEIRTDAGAATAEHLERTVSEHLAARSTGAASMQ